MRSLLAVLVAVVVHAAPLPALAAEQPVPLVASAAAALPTSIDARAAVDEPCPTPVMQNLTPKNPWLAFLGNFAFSGLGYIYNGQKPLIGAGLTLGALGLTYVEFQQPIPSLNWGIMFASVFLVNTMLGIDAYDEAQQITAMAEWQRRQQR